MQTIYVPTFAFFKGDIETMISVLENVPEGFDRGLAIGGRPEHFKDDESLERIVTNIKSIAKGIKTIVHGFSGLEVYEIDGKPSNIANMSKPEGLELLKKYIHLAKELGSEYIHVHGAAGYRGIKTPLDKSEVLGKIRRNLLEGLAHSDEIPIGIENLPSPSACDFDTNHNTVWSDYVEQPWDCFRIVADSPLKVTFDTAHYGINKEGCIDLIEPVKYAIGNNHLGHIHAVDCSGYWKPNVSKAYDGSIPGDGRIGKDSFEKFFKYVSREHPNIGICLEIRPADFQNPHPEFKEAINRVCGWVNSA